MVLSVYSGLDSRSFHFTENSSNSSFRAETQSGTVFPKISWKTLKHWKYLFLWNFPIARFPINGCHSETRHMQTAANHNLFLNLMSSALNPIKPRHNCHEWFGVLVINLSLVWLQLVSLTCCFELCINAVSTQMRKVTSFPGLAGLPGDRLAGQAGLLVFNCASSHDSRPSHGWLPDIQVTFNSFPISTGLCWKSKFSGAQKWDFEHLNPKTDTTISRQHTPKIME